MNYGEFAALLAALMWTLSSMLWGRIHLSALAINAGKNCIGCLFILVHLIVVGSFTQQLSFTTSPTAWGWISLSGIAGIVVGDTLYFRSLQILGPRRSLIIACFSPLFATVLGYLFLQERLGPAILIGILLTMGGVVAVVADRRADIESPGLLPGNFRAGIACGIAGAFCQAIGGLFSKQGMMDCGPLEATAIRLLIAAVVTVGLLLTKSQHRQSLRRLLDRNALRILVPATALGTWMGIWLSQVAYKHGDLGVTQTLLSTCPLFAIPIVYFVDGHRANRVAVVGTIIALIGIWLTVRNHA